MDSASSLSAPSCPSRTPGLTTDFCSEQNALAQKLVFEDQGLSFSVGGGGEASDPAALDKDYDTPAVWMEDLCQIEVEGLRYVGGLDISFVDDSTDEQASDPDVEGSNTALEVTKADVKEPDAYATIVVLEFPSLKVCTF